MRAPEVLELVRPVVQDDTDLVIYVVEVGFLNRTGAGRVLNVLLAGMLDTMATRGAWCLCASTKRGTLVNLNLWEKSVSEVVEVPNWNPAWRDGFEKVVIDTRSFKRLARLKI
jgi:hypothetical protein